MHLASVERSEAEDALAAANGFVRGAVEKARAARRA
jgi:hypothetical protein